VQGWGQLIFVSAGEMVQNEKMRAIYDTLPKEREKLEAKYGVKRKQPETPAKDASASSTASPTPAPSTPGATDSLLPPALSNDADSTASTSDGELVSPPSPATPSKVATPKSPGKKGKKRK